MAVPAAPRGTGDLVAAPTCPIPLVISPQPRPLPWVKWRCRLLAKGCPAPQEGTPRATGRPDQIWSALTGRRGPLTRRAFWTLAFLSAFLGLWVQGYPVASPLQRIPRARGRTVTGRQGSRNARRPFTEHRAGAPRTQLSPGRALAASRGDRPCAWTQGQTRAPRRCACKPRARVASPTASVALGAGGPCRGAEGAHTASSHRDPWALPEDMVHHTSGGAVGGEGGRCVARLEV